MKYLMFFISLNVFAQFPVPGKDYRSSNNLGQFEVYQVDPDTDISSLNAPKNYLKDIKREKVISTTLRDSILIRHLGAEVEKMDELDRDLIMKCSIHYDQKQFSKKYPQYKKKYPELSKEFRELVP